MQTRFVAQRHIDAPPEVVYRCLADYRTHHRPEGFLPPVFSAMEVHRGGVGAGTEASWTLNLGGRARRMTATISEPKPGQTLVETGSNVVTTFTVTPAGTGCDVRFDTVLEEPGLVGVMLRLTASRLLGPVYEDELQRLEVYAQRQAAAGMPA